MTELEQAIAWLDSFLEYHNDDTNEFGGRSDDSETEKVYFPVGHMRRLHEAARVVADIERLPKPYKIDMGERRVIVGEYGLDIYGRGPTLSDALRAALEKVGG
jgi:hypothetical protein